MFRLTDNRFDDAKPVLSVARRRLYEQGKFDCPTLEQELREIWKTGFQEIKSAMQYGLFNERPGYKYVALYFMENNGFPRPNSDYNGTLQKFYPTTPTYVKGDPDNSTRFWAAFNSDEARSLRREIDRLRLKIAERQIVLISDATGGYDETAATLAKLQEELRELTGEEC